MDKLLARTLITRRNNGDHRLSTHWRKPPEKSADPGRDQLTPSSNRNDEHEWYAGAQVLNNVDGILTAQGSVDNVRNNEERQKAKT